MQGYSPTNATLKTEIIRLIRIMGNLMYIRIMGNLMYIRIMGNIHLYILRVIDVILILVVFN